MWAIMRRASWSRFSSVLLAAVLAAGADTPAEKLRARAWDTLRSKVHDPDHLRHALATEAIMRVLANPKLDDANEWGLAGLLHDIDLDAVEGDLSRHGVLAEKSLREIGVSDAVVHAIASHDDHTGIARTSRLDHGLYVADQMYWRLRSGKEKDTAPEELAKEASQIGFSMSKVTELSVSAMRKISANQFF